MLHRKPLECPACGHEHVARRTLRPRVEAGKVRPGGIQWTCRLCEYRWMASMAPTADDWEIA
jgi:hypothetical protein